MSEKSAGFTKVVNVGLSPTSAWGIDQSEWPLRLLHVPSMTSVQSGPGHTYGCEQLSKQNLYPRYNILSYTWGRWRSNSERPVGIKGTTWKIPAVRPEHFTPKDFEQVLRLISKDVDYVWVDVACINQGQSPQDVAEGMDQVGKQMGIFSRASQAYVWLNHLSKADLEKSLDGVIEPALGLGDELSNLQKAKHISVENEKSVCELLEGIRQASRSLCSDPWFSSLLTLQEAALRRDAIILSREERYWLTTARPCSLWRSSATPIATC
jgi:hypothetical protein